MQWRQGPVVHLWRAVGHLHPCDEFSLEITRIEGGRGEILARQVAKDLAEGSLRGHLVLTAD